MGKIEDLRSELIKLIEEKGILDKETILLSQKLDRLIVSYYKLNN